MSLPLSRDIRRDAFSLVELLFVMAIVGLLIGLATPSFMGIGRSHQLASGGQTLVDMLNYGRQIASTQNRRVEVRIYKLPDETGAAAAYRAIQLFLPQTTGTKALTRISWFPSGVEISTDSDASSLLGASSDPNFGPFVVTNPTLPIHGVGNAYRYVSFHFFSNGETDLNPAYAGQWCLSVVSPRDKIVSNNLPANYVCIRVDPMTGKVNVFQP